MLSITNFTPIAAYAGDAVIISGTNFTNATAVKFGDFAAVSFTVISDSLIVALVGENGTTGAITVTTPAGNALLAGFTFLGARPVGVKVKMPNSPAYADGTAPADTDLLWVWDVETSTLRKAPISSLPFSADGGGAGTVTNLGSPFPVRITDQSYVPNPDGSCTITDVRLIGKTDFAISSTQLNISDFEDGQVTYDPDNGAVTILNFQLNAGEKLRIYADGVINTQLAAFMNTMQAKLTKYDQMLSVFTPTALGATAARVWWTGPIGDIPVGWTVDLTHAGKIPVAQDTSDDDFNFEPGNDIGSKNLVLSTTDMLPKFSLFTVVDDQLSTPGHPSSIGRGISKLVSMIRYYLKSQGGLNGQPGTETYELAGAVDNTVVPTLSPTSPIGKDIPDPMKNIPKGMVGVWIKYTGI